MEMGCRDENNARQGRPSHLTEPSNLTATKRNTYCAFVLYIINLLLLLRTAGKRL